MFPYFGYISVNIRCIELKPFASKRKLNSTEGDGFFAHQVVSLGRANWIFYLSTFEQVRLPRMKIGHDVTKWSCLENKGRIDARIAPLNAELKSRGNL